jgi:hypothetical protein
MFWSEPDARLEELRPVLRPGGLIAVAHQPRGRGRRARCRLPVAGKSRWLLPGRGSPRCGWEACA